MLFGEEVIRTVGDLQVTSVGQWTASEVRSTSVDQP